MSTVVRDDILQYVVPFVQQNLGHEKWNHRDAAVQAFAAVMDGPSADNLKQLVSAAIMPILGLMGDPVPPVKDSVAYSVGQICDLVPEAIVNDSFLSPVVTALLGGLQMEVRLSGSRWMVSAVC